MTWVRTSERRRTSKSTKDGREMTRVFMVEFDDATDTDVAERAPGLPTVRSRFLTELGALTSLVCDSVSAEPLDMTRFAFDVTVEYSTPKGANAQRTKDEPTNPLLREPKIEWDFEDSTVPLYFEVDDRGNLDTRRPVVNSCGQPFEPSVERDVSDLMLRVTRNEGDFDPVFALKIKNATNSDKFLGFDPNKCKIKRITAKQTSETQPLPAGQDGEETTIFYWEVTYEIVIRQDGWRAQVINQGLMQTDVTDPTKLVPILAKGQPVTEPVPLSANGTPLAPAADKVALSFQRNPKTKFADLKFV